MKRFLKKLFALLICSMVVFCNLDVNIFAQDIEIVEEETQNKYDESENETSNIDLTEQEENSEVDTNFYRKKINNRCLNIDYLFIEKPVLIAPDNQNIILSISDNLEISQIKVVLENERGIQIEIDGVKHENRIYQFNRNFSSDESGEYVLKYIEYMLDDSVFNFILSDLNMDVRFGVNQIYDGYGESEGYSIDENGNEMSSNMDDSSIQSQIVSLKEENENKAIELIDNAFQNEINTYSNGNEVYTQENPLIIALDPGHGGVDGGMTAINGITEKVYTLKIANYLKKELEKYNNCKVLMTRAIDEYVDLEERAKKASNYGASVLISLHLNSANKNAHGAEVYYPNSNYNSAVSEIGKNLAQKVLNELALLGIADRGIKVKYIYDEITGDPANDPMYDYPDGSIGDYYGIIRHCKNRGISAIIVEHCFADNVDDFNKFLSSEEKIKNLAKADANGIAKAFNLTTVTREDIDELARQNKNAITDGRYKIGASKNSNYVLDIQNESKINGGNLQIYEDHETKAQEWKISHDEKGYITFTNVNSGLVLDVANGTAKPGQNVQQYASNGTYAQKWIAVDEGDKYRIVSAIDPNYVLDISNGKITNKTNVQIYNDNGTNAQRWIFKQDVPLRNQLDELARQNKNAITDGRYKIGASKNSNYVLDIQNESKINGGNLQIYEDHETKAQEWKISHDEKGYITFTNVNSGLVLDVANGTAKPGQNVQQYASNGTYAQKWIAVDEGDKYRIVSAIDPNYVLDISNGKIANKTNVQIYNDNGTNAQRWIFKQDVPLRNQLDELARQNKNAITDGRYKIGASKNSNYVLDIQNESKINGGNLQIYEDHETKAQEWKISHDEKGYITFTNVNSGLVLDVANGTAKPGQNVQQYASNGTYAQKWIAVDEGDKYRIVSAIDPNYVLDISNGKIANKTNVQIYNDNGTNAQRWIFKQDVPLRNQLDELARQNKNAITDGRYKIGASKNSNYVLDIQNESKINGGNLQIYEDHETKAQEWKISHDEKGYITFTNVNSGLVLDVANGTAKPGQNVQQYASNGTYAQKWIAVDEGDKYRIVSAIDPNYVLDISNGKIANKTNVQIYNDNGTNAQRWIFKQDVSLRDELDKLADKSKNVMNDGNYIIKTVNLHYVLGTDNNSLNNVIISNLDNSPYQIWTLSHDSKGYVSFKNYFTDTYLSVENNSVFNSNNVVLQKWNNSYNQKWIVQINKKGKIMITSALDSNFVLDVQGGSLQNGTNVQIYESNLSNAQQWIFSPIQNIPEQQLHPIMGSTSTTINKMVSLFKKYNNHYDKGYKSGSKYDGILAKGGASTIEEFCKMYYEEAQAEGVKAEIAFAQAMIETGWLTFGGDVKPDQYNFAGMGATGNGVSGNSYQNVRIGIRAQIQHLKCYASKEPLNQSLVDQRWSDSLRGKAEYVEYLSIPNNPYGAGWASDKNYADKILNIVREM